MCVCVPSFLYFYSFLWEYIFKIICYFKIKRSYELGLANKWQTPRRRLRQYAILSLKYIWVWQWHFGDSVLEKWKHWDLRMCHQVVYRGITHSGKYLAPSGCLSVENQLVSHGPAVLRGIMQLVKTCESVVILDVHEILWGKPAADSCEELGPMFCKNRTEYSDLPIRHLCVFMSKEKVWKNIHLTGNVDHVCVLEEFGKVGRRENGIFHCTPQFSWTCSRLVCYFCNKEVPQSIKLKKCAVHRTQCLVGGMHATNRSCCCYCWQRALQVAKVGSKQSWGGAESRWELEPVAYLVSPISYMTLAQPLTTPSLSLFICVMGVVIPAPQGSEED